MGHTEVYILYSGDCSRSGTGVRLCPVGTMMYVGGLLGTLYTGEVLYML